MISHLLSIGAVQWIRCLIGLVLGGFLVFRSGTIPFERLSRLEPGDPTCFLAAGIAILALAVLRGIQGGATLGEVLKVRRPGGAGRRSAWMGRMRILFPVLAGSAIAIAGIAAFWVHLAARGMGPVASFVGALAGQARLALILGWIAVIAIVLGILFLPLRGRSLRRFGTAMAIFDIVDLTGFPITMAAGTYGFLVYRHPDTIDFFEGVYSKPVAPPARETRPAA